MKPGAISDKSFAALERIVGPKRISVDALDLENHAKDMWPRLLIAKQRGQYMGTPPHAVLWPESEREIAAIVRIAIEQKIPITPYAGGSGVCGGAVPISGGISLDMKRMKKMLSVDTVSRQCHVEAGMNGERFERQLQHRGLTFGNFPSSIYCSTVGGWMATRAAGQMSTKYGKADDRVLGLRMVTGRGDIVDTTPNARGHKGPNWTQMILGSEGTFGIICSAKLKLSANPALRVLRGYHFDSVAEGTNAIKVLMQKGLKPAVIRLYDEMDTLLHLFKSSGGDDGEKELSPVSLEKMSQESKFASFIPTLLDKAKSTVFTSLLSTSPSWSPAVDVVASKVAKKGCRMIIGFEGSRIRTEVEAEIARKVVLAVGGEDLGEGPGLDWLKRRYSVSYKMSPVFSNGAFVDTMEVVSTWAQLPDLYRRVRKAIQKHAFVMAHFSHAYQEGCSIYFTFAASADSLEESYALYDQLWSDAMQATCEVGGSISHHHGVGLVRSPYMRDEHRESFRILEALKRTMDPHGIMNPGKLGFKS